MTRRLGIALAIVLAAVVQLAPAHAQTTTCPSAPTYAPSAGTAAVSDATPTPGQSITVSGGGFDQGSTVTVSLNPGGTALGTATAGSDCSFSTSVTIPTSVLAGSYTIQASGTDPSGNARVLSAAIVVSATGAGLPTTGANNAKPLTAAGIGLVLMGAAAVVIVRRRRGAADLD